MKVYKFDHLLITLIDNELCCFYNTDTQEYDDILIDEIKYWFSIKFETMNELSEVDKILYESELTQLYQFVTNLNK